MRRTLALLLVCLISHLTSAQPVSVLNLKRGLSNNYVECMLQDAQGYLWIGTRDGLNRYNGYHVDIFKEQLPSSFIYSLLQISNGEIWIGTSQGGVSIYNPKLETFETLSKRKGFEVLANKDVYRLFEADDHSLWIATLQGLGKIPASRDTLFWFEKYEHGQLLAFTSICQDKNKNLWIGTRAGLFTADQSSPVLSMKPVVSSTNLSAIFIRDIFIDKRGMLWLATDADGIFLYDVVHDKITSHRVTAERGKDAQVWNLFSDRNGNLWAAVINGGLFHFDAASNAFVNYQKHLAPHFNSESITSILEDFNGNLWVASHGDGVCYFNPTKYIFEKYLSSESSVNKKPVIVSSFLEDHQHAIWIGTDGEGVKEMRGNKIVDVLSVRNGLSSNTVLDMIEDRAHHLWLATWQGGVDNVDVTRKKVAVFKADKASPFALRNANVKSLMLDSANTLWMVTHGDGIATYDENKKQFIDPSTRLREFHSSDAQWGSDILRTRSGDVWIASHAGLFRYTSSHSYYYSGGMSLSSSIVYCLFEDSHGDIWAGTNNALEKFCPEKNVFENYSERFGIPGNVKCIREADDHTLWISTIHQIVQFDPLSKKLRHFDESYNLQEGQFHECACMKSSSGKMYFGGTEGFNTFFPDSVKENTSSPRLLITNLFLFNKRQVPGERDVLQQGMPFTREVNLLHDQNVVSFEFLALNYSAFARNLYSYRLDGFNTAWSPPEEARLATYTNLDPGHYVFRVRLLSLDGKVLNEAHVAVNVIPPFWKTTWFRVVSVLMLLILTVGYLLLRLYWSKQKRLSLEKLVSERTREVREKNVLLEKHAADLQSKNHALIEQEEMIRQQASTLAQQRDQLQQNNVALQDLVSTKNRLFSIIAHDLRNPFTSLLGFTKLLSTEYNRYTEPDRQKIIRSLHHSSSTIYSLLDNLLLWSKSQQQSLVFEPAELYFAQFVSDHFDLIRDEAEKKGVSLVMTSDNDVCFVADANMLSIILRNLLSNAVKYSSLSGVVHVGYHMHSTGIEIYVRDQGAGIEEPSSLFHVDARRQRDHNHGLGLILCKEFVEKHGGTIVAENNETSGACFRFTLPQSRAFVLNARSWREHAVTERADNGTSARLDTSLPLLLIAEDDDEIRWYIKQTLVSDFQIIEARDGSDAATFAFDKMPDIVISDMNMPGRSGVELCAAIKAHPQTSHIPFIMLTAEKGSARKIEGFQTGADDYITKPVDPGVLRVRIHNILETRRKLKTIYQRDFTVEPAAFTANTIDQEFLQKLNAIIERRLADSELNPDLLAKEMSMSRTGLYIKVKALTGESVSIYVRNTRLKESCKLLRAGRMNISEVAFAVGFNQLPYFTSCFKEAFGVTPTEYISRQKI